MGIELNQSAAVLNARDLMQKKDLIEKEIREYEQVLEGQKIGMFEPLIDRSGFPRDDIDLVAVRTARAKIISIMNKIEQALHEIHAENKANRIDSSSEAENSTRENRSKPFAIINAVAPDSPAKEAKTLDIRILREEEILSLKLTPRSGWGERGLLG
ncbi:7956_t:CDS:2 [Diversispora eburnea]|uniref:7956_t:CDS:1 n=1 Tax=Diversispora eburnea TaxID=1213867 RepID=A0A9N9F9A1_9GLOM|nr:7956_t:CDS:2 [Diversispora eburnea]